MPGHVLVGGVHWVGEFLHGGFVSLEHGQDADSGWVSYRTEAIRGQLEQARLAGPCLEGGEPQSTRWDDRTVRVLAESAL